MWPEQTRIIFHVSASDMDQRHPRLYPSAEISRPNGCSIREPRAATCRCAGPRRSLLQSEVLPLDQCVDRAQTNRSRSLSPRMLCRSVRPTGALTCSRCSTSAATSIATDADSLPDPRGSSTALALIARSLGSHAYNHTHTHVRTTRGARTHTHAHMYVHTALTRPLGVPEGGRQTHTHTYIYLYIMHRST